MKVTVLRTDGREEEHELSQATAWPELKKLLAAETFDTVNLRNGKVMIVDDAGWESEERPLTDGRNGIELVPLRPRKPFNDKATALYRTVAGALTAPPDFKIVGDVAIVTDSDFA